VSFTTGTQAELLFSMPASVTKNTYTTIAAITGVAGTNEVCSIPAGLFGPNPNPVGRSLLLEVWGTIANTAAATFAMNINVNPTAGTSTNNLAINTAYTPTASVTAPWRMRAYLTCTAFATSTFTLQANGTVTYQTVASGGAVQTACPQADFTGTFATSMDPRVQQYVELFGTWSSSSSSNTTTVQQMFLWGLN
jgi:hypothetical protein